MSRYIEQEHIGKTVSNLPTEVFQTENRIELVLSATEVIDAIKDAPSIEIIHCRECKHYKLNGACMRLDRKMLAVRPNDFCSYGMRNADPNTLNTLDALDDNSSEKPNNSTISKMEQVDKDINVRSKDEPKISCDGCRNFTDGGELCDLCALGEIDNYEPQTEKLPLHVVFEMALDKCKRKHKGCENCDMDCMWRDKPQTEREGE